MVKLSICIMTHPKRLNYAKSLFNQLSIYKDINVSIVNDINSEGHSFNGFQAWLNYDLNSTHHLVLEDDVQLCNNFIEKVYEIINVNNNELISLFHIKNKQIQLFKEKYNYCPMNRISWNQAIILPTKLVIQMFDFIKNDFEYKWTDDFLTAFCKEYQIPMLLTIPNLVQHILPKNSIVGNPPKLGNKERISPVFIDDLNKSVNFNKKNIFKYNL